MFEARLGRAGEDGDGGCAYGTQATTREAGRSAGLGGSALGEHEMREVRGYGWENVVTNIVEATSCRLKGVILHSRVEFLPVLG